MHPKTAFIFALLPLTYAASSCNSATSKDWPIVFDPNASAVTNCDNACVNEVIAVPQQQPCVTKCLALAGLGPDNKMLKKRRTVVDLNCASSEVCYKYTDGSFLCLKRDTGKYHDDEGGIGDVNTGAYEAGAALGDDSDDDTSSASVKESSTRGPAATLTRSSTAEEPTTTSTRPVGAGGATVRSSTGSNAEATSSSAGAVPTTVRTSTTGTGTGVAPVATSTPTGGVGTLSAQMGSALGVVGLVFGLMI